MRVYEELLWNGTPSTHTHTCVRVGMCEERFSQDKFIGGNSWRAHGQDHRSLYSPRLG